MQSGQKNTICLYSQESVNDLRATIQQTKENGYDMMVCSLVVSKVNNMISLTNEERNFSRSDIILESQEWSNNIIAKINDEFDCDSENDAIRLHSEKMLSREIDFADHVITYGFSLLKLTGAQTTNLARIVSSKQLKGQLLLEVPMVDPKSLVATWCTTGPNDSAEYEDPWNWWNTFRSTADFSSKLSIALELSSDIPSKIEITRWQGEPVGCLIVPSQLFVRNNNNYPVLSRAHQNLILSFKEIMSNIAVMVKCNMEDGSLRYYSDYLKNLLSRNPNTDPMYGFDDILETPLQPLYDNLDGYTYEVFEADPIKYLYYQKAIEKALIDLVKEDEIETKTTVVMVVGAGRGPLLRSSLNAAAKSGRKIKLYAIEKNPHAINSLQSLIDELWSDKDIELIAKDMRDFHPPEKADILVSELLGSFGDNELSPECLDGAQKLLKPTGISIPSKYTSYINPVMSSRVYNLIRRCSERSTPRERITTPQNHAEHMYVIYLKNAYHIASPEALFTFEHPNWSDRIDNSRFKTVSFETEIDCVLTGFAGYFDTVLYKDIVLSIHPLSHSKGLASWFPAFFPLMEPVQLRKGEKVTTSFWRCVAPNKVWYEWCLSKPIPSHIHNLKGIHYAIYL
ncbi:Protein arginine N-methyltransferase 5 [Pseudolycoriella hygida]|uniref:Protein arginine N-methyltransferase n=1 Tax=Pseudolycoriella hygida TaxID=35572 RepID=A0A9Q0RYS3_9DIPT|nr:Protein arginine N-methyltransferase 5 [Pseudolycoriella hygida]